jgi:hypothetical protein
MKKFLLLFLFLFLLLCLGGIVLTAPVVLLFTHVSSPQALAETLQDQLNAFSTFTIVEENGQTDDTSLSKHSITLTITEKDMNRLLYNCVTAKKSPFITIEKVESDISAETIYVVIDFFYGLFGFQTSDSIMSEWMVRVSPASSESAMTSRIEIKPVDIHTSYLYSVNFVELWNVVKRGKSFDGWLPLPLDPELQIEDIILWEDEIAVSIASGL